MRPLQLTMTAFGSYVNTTIIDFETVGNQGLLVITGPTGAGKTTIFDAIMFALYGQTSGDIRDAAAMRSENAKPSQQTSVKLTFLYKNTKYTILRLPKQVSFNTKTQQTGKIDKQEQVTLSFYDGTPPKTQQEANAQIIQILGVNAQRFKQIAMIAQGKFQEVLFCDTKKRMEMFRQLFNTEPYQRLQDLLKENNKQTEIELTQLTNQIQTQKNLVQSPIDSPLAQQLNNQVQPSNEILQIIEQIIQEDKENLQQNRKKKEINDRLLEQATQRLAQLDAFEEKQKELTLIQKTILELKIQLDNIKIQKENAEKSAEQKGTLVNEKGYYENLLPKCNELENLQKTIDKTAIQIKEYEESASKMETKQKKQEEQIEKYNLQLTQTKDVGAHLTDKKNQITQLEKEINAATKLLANLQEYISKSSTYVLEKKNSKSLEERYKQQYNELNKKETIFLNDYAGVLAQQLVEGIPCPVCGSIHHPQLAKKHPDTPSFKDIENTKKELEKIEKEKNDLIQYCDKLHGSLLANGETIKMQYQELLNEPLKEGIKARELLSIVSNYQNSLKNQINDEKKELAQLELQKKQRDEIEKVLPQLNTEKDRLIQLLHNVNISINTATIQKQNDEKQLGNILNELSTIIKKDENRLSSETVIKEIKNKIKELEEQIKNIEKEVTKTRDDFIKTETKLQQTTEQEIELQKQVKEKCSWNRLSEEKAKKEASETILSLQNFIAGLEKNVETNLKLKSQLAVSIQKWTECDDKFSWLTVLSKTANGELSGKDKLSLEAYVQQTYFIRVLYYANLRLSELSDGQYELKLKTRHGGRAQAGLELIVSDHSTGTTRDVKNLSGGEIFKASLSLALGLADEVQMSNGGIRIDTIFIDEGFGSLDRESRLNAINTLNKLSENTDRLICIISHTDELRDSANKKIEVRKSKFYGSTVKLIF